MYCHAMCVSSCHVVSCHVTLCHVMSCMSYHPIIPCRVKYCHQWEENRSFVKSLKSCKGRKQTKQASREQKPCNVRYARQMSLSYVMYSAKLCSYASISFVKSLKLARTVSKQSKQVDQTKMSCMLKTVRNTAPFM